MIPEFNIVKVNSDMMNEIIRKHLDNLEKNVFKELQNERKSKIEEDKKENKDITPKNDEVLIYFDYENKDDLIDEIKEIIEIFGENIINDLYVDTDEKLVSIKTFKTITQSEIVDLFNVFETNNIKINYCGDALWIIINDVI